MLSEVMDHYGLLRDFMGQAAFFETDHARHMLKELKLAIKLGKLVVLSGIGGRWWPDDGPARARPGGWGDQRAEADLGSQIGRLRGPEQEPQGCRYTTGSRGASMISLPRLAGPWWAW
jgi:hypothetical protein